MDAEVVSSFESKVFPVLYESLKDISKVKVTMQKSCVLTTEVDGLDENSSPETLIKKAPGASISFQINDIAVNFTHENGVRETIGKLTTKVILSSTRGRNVVVLTMDTDFDRNFRDLEMLTEGFGGILKAYADNFKKKNDTSYAVYFELCNKFFVSKLAIKLGFFPGWLNHAMSSGTAYNYLKTHLLFLIDKFLDVDDCNTISIDTLVANECKIERQDVCHGIMPRNCPENSVTMVFYYPLWNRDTSIEDAYEMDGPFWTKNTPKPTKTLLEEFFKKYTDRSHRKDDMLKVLANR
jgi:hypothetical protein